MKKYSLIIVCFISLTVFSQEEKSIYDTFFSDPKKEMPVPYLEGQKELEYYTSYKNTNKFLAVLAEKHPDIIKISDIGKTQRGSKMPMVMLSLKNNIPDAEKVRVTYIGGVHGNEPISSDGLLYLIHELTEKGKYKQLLEKVILQVLPIVNVDGRIINARASNNGTDLNRNLNILSVPETVNLRNAINLFDPQVVIDFHEFNPNRKDFKEMNDCLTSGIDAQFLFTGNLNVVPEIRKMIETDFVEPTKLVLKNNNRTVANYSSTFWNGQSLHLNLGAISSRSSASNYALQNRISILMELRGVTEREKTVKRRIETSFLTATSYLSIVNKKANEIKKTVLEANEATINNMQPIVVSSNAEIIEGSYRFVNTCTNETEIIYFETKNNLKHTAVKTRERAAGYVIVTKNKHAAEVLKNSGIVITKLAKPTLLELQAYKLDNKNAPYLISTPFKLPAGAIIIDAKQKMGNLLVDLLEPELSNSLVANKTLKKIKGTDLMGLFRINKNQLLQLQNIK